MKEAAGEANMTVITIVLIAIVLAVGTIVVRTMMGNTDKASRCESVGGVYYAGYCYPVANCDESGVCSGNRILTY